MLIAFWRWPFYWWHSFVCHFIINPIDGLRGSWLPTSFDSTALHVFLGGRIAFEISRPIIEERFIARMRDLDEQKVRDET